MTKFLLLKQQLPVSPHVTLSPGWCYINLSCKNIAIVSCGYRVSQKSTYISRTEVCWSVSCISRSRDLYPGWRLDMFCDSKRSSVSLDPRIIFRRCLNDYQIFFLSSNKLFLIVTQPGVTVKYINTIHNKSREVGWLYLLVFILSCGISDSYFRYI